MTAPFQWIFTQAFRKLKNVFLKLISHEWDRRSLAPSLRWCHCHRRHRLYRRRRRRRHFQRSRRPSFRKSTLTWHCCSLNPSHHLFGSTFASQRSSVLASQDLPAWRRDALRDEFLFFGCRFRCRCRRCRCQARTRRSWPEKQIFTEIWMENKVIWHIILKRNSEYSTNKTLIHQDQMNT